MLASLTFVALLQYGLVRGQGHADARILSGSDSNSSNSSNDSTTVGAEASTISSTVSTTIAMSTTGAAGNVTTTTTLKGGGATNPPTTTTSGSAGATTTTTVGARVTVTMTVANVDYSQLTANAALMSSFKSAVADTLASKISGVNASDIEVVLKQGSVIVEAKISVPSGSSAASMETTLASDQTLSQGMVTAISNLPNISDVSTGAITVSSVEVATEGATTAPPSGSANYAWRSLPAPFAGLMVLGAFVSGTRPGL